MIQVNRIYLIFNRLVTKKFLVDTSDIGSIITTFAVLMFVNLPKSICAYGSKTLAYYVIQGMFAHILSTYLQVNFYQALFLCVCILVLTTVLLRFVDSKFITNPFSTLLKWKY